MGRVKAVGRKELEERWRTADNPISAFVLEDRMKVSTALVPRNARTLLDVGCGEGHFLKRLSEELPEATLVGVDLCRANIEFAKKNASRARFFVSDARKLGFRSSSFDCVALLEVLEHISYPHEVLEEIRRVLKPGGTLLVSVPDSGKILWKVLWILWTNLVLSRWKGAHPVDYDEKKLRALLVENGFHVMEARRAFFGMVMVFKARVKK